MLESNRKWWRDFWSAASSTCTAPMVSPISSSRLHILSLCQWQVVCAANTPRFGGMLWYSNGDLRAGDRFTGGPTKAACTTALPRRIGSSFSIRPSRCTRRCSTPGLAAKQQWGSSGIWIPETTWFNGEPRCQDDIADEMRRLYLLQKPWSDRSEALMRMARSQQSFNSRWNWISQDGHYELGEWVLEAKARRRSGSDAYLRHDRQDRKSLLAET